MPLVWIQLIGELESEQLDVVCSRALISVLLMCKCIPIHFPHRNLVSVEL